MLFDKRTSPIGPSWILLIFLLCVSCLNAAYIIDGESSLRKQTNHLRHRRNQQSDLHWVRRGPTLYGEEKNARFGASVATSSDGNIIAVGSPGCSVNPRHCVRVYEKRWNANNNNNNNNNNNRLRWRKLGSIRGYVEKTSKGDFKPISGGASVSLSANGRVLAVGYPDASNENVKSTGVVVVYKRQGKSKRWKSVGSPIYGDAFNDQIGGTSDTQGGPNDEGYQHDRWSWTWYKPGYGSWGRNDAQLVENLTGIEGLYNEMPVQASTSVSLSPNGKVLAIGYHNSKLNAKPNDTFDPDRGYVRVFRFHDESSINDWMEVGHPVEGMQTVDDDWGEQFGFSVSLSRNGHCLLAGAPVWDAATGQARAYRLNETAEWEPMGQVLEHEYGTADQEAFGASVAMSSDCQCIAVSKPEFTSRDKKPGVTVYDYDALKNTWQKRGKEIVLDFWSVDSALSIAVSRDCQRVAIGEPQRDALVTGIHGAYVGSVSVHEWNKSNSPFVPLEGYWSLVDKKLVAPDTKDYHGLFGYAIDLSLDGNLLVVGAPLSRHAKDDPSQPLNETVVGQVHVFELLETRRY